MLQEWRRLQLQLMRHMRSTWLGIKWALAPGTTTMVFSPFWSIQIFVNPVEKALLTTKQSLVIWYRSSVSKMIWALWSFPMEETNDKTQGSETNLAIATAWFRPLPPQRIEKDLAKIVSPTNHTIPYNTTSLWKMTYCSDHVHIWWANNNNRRRHPKDKKCVNRELNPDLYLGRVES